MTRPNWTGIREMAGLPVSTSNESETLRLLYNKLSTSIDIDSLLPVAYSFGIINDRQREACKNKSDVYKKTEAFLDYLQIKVRENPAKFHGFIDVLRGSDQKCTASLVESS